jgi:pyridoxine/pyridoxamine 5'-phosphate oxidase
MTPFATVGQDGRVDADDRDTAARAIIDELAFMTLATVDAQGAPWACPVWFAHADYSEFLWVSRPETRHSRNIAATPRIAIVIFDSRTPINTGRGVYIEAEAAEVTDEAEIEQRIAIFSERSLAQGGSGWTADEIRPPAELRPYSATVSRAFLGVNDRRTEVRLSR